MINIPEVPIGPEAMDFDEIDSIIDDLTEQQFSILSWIACGKNRHELLKMTQLDDADLYSEVNTIKSQFDVDDVFDAAKHYSKWIDIIGPTLD